MTVEGREVGVFNIGGRLYGLLNRCAHMGGPVCAAARTTGTLVADAEGRWLPRWEHEGEIVACPWHGLEYHVPTGRCLAFPHIRLRRYQVLVEDDQVVVRFAKPKRRRREAGA